MVCALDHEDTRMLPQTICVLQWNIGRNMSRHFGTYKRIYINCWPIKKKKKYIFKNENNLEIKVVQCLSARLVNSY